jgi:hypothetical protein
MRSVKRKTSAAKSSQRLSDKALKKTTPRTKLEPRPQDPLLWDYDLSLRGTYYPLGFPLDIQTNSPDVLRAAEESWGRFQKSFSTPPVQIRLGVLPGSSSVCPPEPVCRGQRNLITQVADAENYLVSDIREGFSFGWVTEAVARNHAYLRYHFIEGAPLMLLECLYLTPVHAACISLHGRGVLLCGDGGAGKSSLSYACARNGWTFLSDDSAMLMRKNSGRRVIGNPYQIRFRDSATELFPELRTAKVSQRLSGELSIELATASVPGIATTSECHVDYLVFLNRYHPEPEGLFRFPKETALSWLNQVVCYGDRHLRDKHKAVLEQLAAGEIFEMRYTKMATALRLLEGLVRDRHDVVDPCLVAAGEH